MDFGAAQAIDNVEERLVLVEAEIACLVLSVFIIYNVFFT